MLVLLNLQQMGLIFNNLLKMLLKTLLCFLLKKLLYEEDRPGETGFLICKGETSVAKSMAPSREGISLQVIRNVFL